MFTLALLFLLSGVISKYFKDFISRFSKGKINCNIPKSVITLGDIEIMKIKANGDALY
jgi:hypothetical protein